MFKKILGILFLIAGTGALVGAGRPRPDFATGIVGVVIGLFLIYKSVQSKPRKNNSNDMPLEQPIKTFSFQIAGFRFNCRFPTTRFEKRQILLNYCKLGDVISLRQFEWEGESAFALINDKYGADIGVVPAEYVNTVLKLNQEYTVHGKIIELNKIQYKGESYTICSVELDCYARDN